ncbi:MAG: imidazole glycerol phosphate synthase subunit HisH, partial [Atopobiaceae bacterium]|nr:imidazole glycerol phosphate synthase subunit HisH [Atopobiaceae bacterium]
GIVEVTDDPARISSADAIELPGVGNCEDAMGYMRSSEQDAAIVGSVKRGVPFLGLCLGTQVIFERGSESNDPSAPDKEVDGLGLLAGSCPKLESSRLKIPHVGWDTLDITAYGKDCPLLEGIPDGATMYFTHSYVPGQDVDPSVVAARTHYAQSFPSVIWKDNIYGCQFHPEKSSTNGLRMLRNFVRIVEETAEGASA